MARHVALDAAQMHNNRNQIIIKCFHDDATHYSGGKKIIFSYFFYSNMRKCI